MKTLKTTLRPLSLLTLAACLMGAGPALAKHPHKQRRGHHGKMMRQLDLSKAQKSELKRIRETHRAEKQALRSSTLSKQARKAAMFKLRKSKKQQINALLTPEQKAKRATKRAEHKAKKQARRVQRLARKLELSQTQQSSIADILERAGNRGKAIHQDDSMDFEAHKAAKKAHRKQLRADIQEVLNPEQREQFAKMKKNRRGKHKRRRGKGKGKGRRMQFAQ